MSEAIVQSNPGVANPVAARIDKLAAALGRHERWLLLLGCTFQILILATLTVTRLVPLITGDTILLRVIPVDPRDMFRGDYVILSYDFSRAVFQTPGAESQTVYVQLEPEADGRHWKMAGVSSSRPAQGKFLRGQTRGGRCEVGIESYYVQEGTGRQYEDAIRNRRLSAVVSVTSDGQAALKKLQIE